MKKINVFIIICLLLNACNMQNESNVSGTIKGFGDGEIYIVKSDEEKNIDTIKVVADKFTYKAKVSEPTIYMINFGANQQPAFAVLENGNTTLEYEMNKMNSINIKGGKEQEVYNNFFNQCKPLFASMDSLGKVAEQNASDRNIMTQLQDHFFNIDSQVKLLQKTFIGQHPTSVTAAFLAINYINQKEEKNAAEISSIYNSFDKKVQQSYYGKKIAELVSKIKATTVGQAAPEFTLNDPNGNPIALSSFKGKITLIDFWASWCAPCRKENPVVVAAYNKFHAKGFEILGVSLDDNKSNWTDAIKKDALSWTQVSDLVGWESPIAKQYNVESIPTNFLLDKEGKIIAKDLRGEQLTQTLNEVFK